MKDILVTALVLTLSLEILDNFSRYKSGLALLVTYQNSLYEDSQRLHDDYCQAQPDNLHIEWRVDGQFQSICQTDHGIKVRRYYKISAAISFQAFGRPMGMLEPYLIVFR